MLFIICDPFSEFVMGMGLPQLSKIDAWELYVLGAGVFSVTGGWKVLTGARWVTEISAEISMKTNLLLHKISFCLGRVQKKKSLFIHLWWIRVPDGG